MDSKAESNLLEHAIKQHETINNHLQNTLDRSDVNSKTRVAELNNQSFREKQNLVNKLIYIIYFILFSIGLGISVVTGMISMHTLSILFIVAIVMLGLTLLGSSSFWKTYGDLSMSAGKGITKDIITLVAPVKKCPKRCIKKSYAEHKEMFKN